MVQKIGLWLVLASFAARDFVKSLKDDERGVSGIVVTVILILIGVLLAALLWGVLSGWLQTMWETITNTGDEITTNPW